MIELTLNSHPNPEYGKPSKIRWIVILACIAVCLAGGISGFLIWDNHMISKYGPYGSKVELLHKGMSAPDMFAAIGNPYNPFDPEAPERQVGKVSYDENGVHIEYFYLATGTKLPLSVQFDSQNSDAKNSWIKRWCYNSVCHELD